MEQPSRFVALGEYQGCVCKQSSRAWFGKFSGAVFEFRLQRCQTDHSVFHYIILVVYVDDNVTTGDNSGGIA
jgi:hypothetical protein